MSDVRLEGAVMVVWRYEVWDAQFNLIHTTRWCDSSEEADWLARVWMDRYWS